MAYETIQANILGVDPEEETQILYNLQANILKAHGRDEAYHLFLRFTGDNTDRAKAWIQEYAQDPHHVTSATKQIEDANKRREKPKYSGGLLGCLFLSAEGYRKLGFKVDEFEESFKKGMKDGGDYVIGDPEVKRIENKDPECDDWQLEYRGKIHAMLLLAQNDNEKIYPSLEKTVEEIKESLKNIAEVFCERGRRLFNKEGEDIEHFGYRDGISNPTFATKEELMSDLLARDPLADDDNCYGSYLVFRKLKQDANMFKDQVCELSKKTINKNRALTGAQIVGRFKDGTPVTDPYSLQESDPNDFNYNDDDGRRCPLHAHIRKTNPRDGRERGRRIVRRGIPYGKRGDDDVGLLFMCYQNSIHDQFEFIQRYWVDNPNFPPRDTEDDPPTGVDPLIGQDETKQQWRTAYDKPEADKVSFPFGGHVTLLGGEYFFAPSLTFLQNIQTLQMIQALKEKDRT
jgi:Dyp-type peroxidase family